MGMIDRGADVSILSQFPAEREILFAPLTVHSRHPSPATPPAGSAAPEA